MIKEIKDLHRGDVFYLPQYDISVTLLASHEVYPYFVLSLLTKNKNHFCLTFNKSLKVPVMGQSTEVT